METWELAEAADGCKRDPVFSAKMRTARARVEHAAGKAKTRDEFLDALFLAVLYQFGPMKIEDVVTRVNADMRQAVAEGIDRTILLPFFAAAPPPTAEAP